MLAELQSERPTTGRARVDAGLSPRNIASAGQRLPAFIFDPTFQAPGADREYGPATTPPDDPSYRRAHMPEEATRDLARRMHYAAFRWHESATPEEARGWQRRYYDLRDRIILGNRKLIFRAVAQGVPAGQPSDDLIGECDVVLIQVVAAYNPWLGVRFSTYAFTCLMRALARQRSRRAPALTVRPLSPEVADEHALARFCDDDLRRLDSVWRPLLQHFCKDDFLLSDREKMILERRYQLAGQTKGPTLQEVARDLGISKERVRQLQSRALDKLRRALLGTI
jgi:RNA polymerase sigma factor (sigma-70 family)